MAVREGVHVIAVDDGDRSRNCQFTWKDAEKTKGTLLEGEEEIPPRYMDPTFSSFMDTARWNRAVRPVDVERSREFSDIRIEKQQIIVDGSQMEPSTTENPEEDHAVSNEDNDSEIRDGDIRVVPPHSQLPKPKAPPGLSDSVSNGGYDSSRTNRSQSLTRNLAVGVPAIGNYIRERSNTFSVAIAKRFASLTDTDDSKTDVIEFRLSGLNVIVKNKNQQDGNREEKSLKGQISFFSRSNCRDCTAVRTFLREQGLKFVEINIDVYPSREKELVRRTGTSSVPQIFFNEKLFGGLVALNSLRNSGGFDDMLRKMLSSKCPDDAPMLPVYGFDDPEETDDSDEMLAIVRVLRQKLPIQDRLMKMKRVKNCFSGSEMVEIINRNYDCGREKAIEIGKELARKHFIHHVSGDNDLEDGGHLYRFLEHEPFISRCFNFRGSTNDTEPKSASVVSQRLMKIMSAILESYASEDRHHVDYLGISNSEEFRRYVNLSQDLQRVDMSGLSADDKLAFFLNLYNAMVIHAVIRIGHPGGVADRRSFNADYHYVVGGYPYSLTLIKNGILRCNKRPPYSLVKPFGAGDRRLELTLPKFNPLIHFGLCDGARSSPTVKFFSPQGVEAELRCAAREFLQGGGVDVDLEKRIVYMTKIIKWFDVDFGKGKEILQWMINFLDPTKAGLLTHLLSDGAPVRIVYQNFDWSLNS